MTFFGLNLGVSFKGIDLSVLFQGVTNRSLYIDPTSSIIQPFSSNINIPFNGGTATFPFGSGNGPVQNFWANRWTPATASTATLPEISLGGNVNNTQVSSFWMRNGAYLRLKNAEIGYSLPNSLIKHLHIKQIRFFLNGYNLVTWSGVKSFNIDPETGTSTYYPSQRVINGGISIKL